MHRAGAPLVGRGGSAQGVCGAVPGARPAGRPRGVHHRGSRAPLGHPLVVRGNSRGAQPLRIAFEAGGGARFAAPVPKFFVSCYPV